MSCGREVTWLQTYEHCDVMSWTAATVVFLGWGATESPPSREKEYATDCVLPACRRSGPMQAISRDW